MREIRGQSTTAVSEIGPHASVPAARYYEIAKQHLQANGGKGVVVKERETAAQWRAWLAYFAHLDEQTSPRGKKAPTFRSMRNGATVPTEWPREFDLSAPPAPVFEPREEMPSPERRRQLANMLREVAAGFSLPEASRAQPKPFTLPVGEDKTLFASRPVVSTPDLAKYLEGMRAEQDQQDDEEAAYGGR